MSREIDILSIHNRPRFKIRTRLSKEQFNNKLRKQFQLQNKVLGGYIGEEYSVIRLRKDKEKYWAPQLQIRLEEDEDNPEILWIRGIFGPKIAVWTFFMFLYILSGTVLILFGLIWFVQNRLNYESNIIYWSWVGFGVFSATYLAAHLGQLIAKDNLKVLRDFMEKVVDDELENNFVE